MMRFMFRGLFVWHVVSMMSVQGQTCELTQSLAAVYFDQNTKGCQLNQTQCSLNSVCGDCLEGVDAYSASCIDGCGYTTGDFKVARVILASTGYTTLIGFSHMLLEGEERNMSYFYEAATNVDSNDEVYLSPAFGGVCVYTFNENSCLCEQRYCDDSGNSAANFIDCTEFEGGGVIDYCNLINTGTYPILTAESTMHEMLHWTPIVACLGSPPSTPDDSTTPAPPPVQNTAPTAVPVPTEPVASPVMTPVAETPEPKVPSSPTTANPVPAEPGVSPVMTPVDETPKPLDTSSLTSGASTSCHNNTFLAFITLVLGFGFVCIEHWVFEIVKFNQSYVCTRYPYRRVPTI